MQSQELDQSYSPFDNQVTLDAIFDAMPSRDLVQFAMSGVSRAIRFWGLVRLFQRNTPESEIYQEFYMDYVRHYHDTPFFSRKSLLNVLMEAGVFANWNKVPLEKSVHLGGLMFDGPAGEGLEILVFYSLYQQMTESSDFSSLYMNYSISYYYLSGLSEVADALFAQYLYGCCSVEFSQGLLDLQWCAIFSERHLQELKTKWLAPARGKLINASFEEKLRYNICLQTVELYLAKNDRIERANCARRLLRMMERYKPFTLPCEQPLLQSQLASTLRFLPIMERNHHLSVALIVEHPGVVAYLSSSNRTYLFENFLEQDDMNGYDPKQDFPGLIDIFHHIPRHRFPQRAVKIDPRSSISYLKNRLCGYYHPSPNDLQLQIVMDMLMDANDKNRFLLVMFYHRALRVASAETSLDIDLNALNELFISILTTCPPQLDLFAGKQSLVSSLFSGFREEDQPSLLRTFLPLLAVHSDPELPATASQPRKLLTTDLREMLGFFAGFAAKHKNQMLDFILLNLEKNKLELLPALTRIREICDSMTVLQVKKLLSILQHQSIPVLNDILFSGVHVLSVLHRIARQHFYIVEDLYTALLKQINVFLKSAWESKEDALHQDADNLCARFLDWVRQDKVTLKESEKKLFYWYCNQLEMYSLLTLQRIMSVFPEMVGTLPREIFSPPSNEEAVSLVISCRFFQSQGQFFIPVEQRESVCNKLADAIMEMRGSYQRVKGGLFAGQLTAPFRHLNHYVDQLRENACTWQSAFQEMRKLVQNMDKAPLLSALQECETELNHNFNRGLSERYLLPG